MQKNEEEDSVRLAATEALYNALEFAHSNFSNESERNYLMQVSPPCPLPQNFAEQSLAL